MSTLKITIISIFILAIGIRLLFFSNNIYFGFDQARDAFAALKILNGDILLVGPPTSVEGIHHGVLYYYIYSIIYFLGNGSPLFLSIFFRIFNALGVVLIFFIGKQLFNKKVGLLAAIFYAFSFEQTQFAIYMNHPSLGNITVLLMYLGLSMVVFGNKRLGIILASLGLGLSIQFEFILTYLIAPFLLVVAIYRNEFKKIPLKTYLQSIAIFLLAVLSYILVDLKYRFKTIHALPQIFRSGSEFDINQIIQPYLFTLNKLLEYNLIGQYQISSIVLAGLLILLAVFFFRRKNIKQLLFLSIWFFSLFLIFLSHQGTAGGQPLFYPNAGISASLLIFISFLILSLPKKIKPLGFIVIAIIIFLNLNLIQKINPYGSIPLINVQQGMLISDQKKVLDFIYQDADKKPFAVKALTMPYIVNTTWSYLFEWYGKSKYGYLPTWSGKNALGYPGNLKVDEVQQNLPEKRYLIVEPTVGIPQYFIDEYLQEENYFTKVEDEKMIGSFRVQKRTKL